MLNQKERDQAIKFILNLIVAAGGLLTLSFAIYYIVDLIKDFSK
jgi:hypothetical protein